MVAYFVFQFCARASAGNLDDEEGKVMAKKEIDESKINFSNEKPATPLLDTITYPIHVRNFSLRVNIFK